MKGVTIIIMVAVMEMINVIISVDVGGGGGVVLFCLFVVVVVVVVVVFF